MLIDGVFVPSSNSHGVGAKHNAAKHRELPSMPPPTLTPPATTSPDDAVPLATAEEVLKAANAVSFLPQSSELVAAGTAQKMGNGDRAANVERWQHLQEQQHHADKLYNLMRVCISFALY
jgi:hypothetical protein